MKQTQQETEIKKSHETNWDKEQKPLINQYCPPEAEEAVANGVNYDEQQLI